MKKGIQGFTLIELMAVIAIITTLTFLLFPGVSGLLTKNDLNESAEAVRETIDFARAHATSTNLAHQVVFIPATGDSGGAVQVFQGTSNACLFGATDTLIRHLILDADEEGNISTVDTSKPAVKRIMSTTQITEVSPVGVLDSGLCVRPDGSIRDAATNQPVAPASGATAYGAGDVLLTIQDNVVTHGGGSPSFTPQGTPLKVLIPYNGIARVTY